MQLKNLVDYLPASIVRITYGGLRGKRLARRVAKDVCVEELWMGMF